MCEISLSLFDHGKNIKMQVDALVLQSESQIDIVLG
jgi:hypothetical protein